MKKPYIICQANTKFDLELEVNAKMLNGYVPVGSIATVTMPDKLYDIVMYQAMALPDFFNIQTEALLGWPSADPVTS